MRRLFSKQGLIAAAVLGFAATAAVSLSMGWGLPVMAILWLQWLVFLLGLQIYRVLMPLHAQVIDEHERTQVRVLRQVQSLFQLHVDVTPRAPLPLLGQYAATPDLLATLVSLVKRKHPRVIVELGSGSSTIVCGYALESTSQGKVISFDHEAQYAAETNAALEVHGLSAIAAVQVAPLRETRCGASTWSWYAMNLEELPLIDLLIVDGPPMTTGRLARYPALPVLWSKLAPGAIIVVDDAARPDETEMVRRWIKEFPGLRMESLPHEKGTVILHKPTE